MKAMRERARRGLLSEEEQVLLATLEAERAHGITGGDKECVIM